jgi:hypothetical protein
MPLETNYVHRRNENTYQINDIYMHEFGVRPFLQSLTPN